MHRPRALFAIGWRVIEGSRGNSESCSRPPEIGRLAVPVGRFVKMATPFENEDQFSHAITVEGDPLSPNQGMSGIRLERS
jgi:hypothetical protein